MPNANQDWAELSRALRGLHRALVARARVDYARENLISDDIGPVELLRMLTDDPWFAWLRGLSELMVDIDVIGDGEFGEDMAAAVRASVEYFLTPPDEGEAPLAFASRYWPYVQEVPDVAIAHGEVRRSLSKFPVSAIRKREHLWDHRQRLGDSARERDATDRRKKR